MCLNLSCQSSGWVQKRNFFDTTHDLEKLLTRDRFCRNEMFAKCAIKRRGR